MATLSSAPAVVLLGWYPAAESTVGHVEMKVQPPSPGMITTPPSFGMFAQLMAAAVAFFGVGVPTVKSLRLLSVSKQPLPPRRTDDEAEVLGVLMPSEQLVFAP